MPVTQLAEQPGDSLPGRSLGAVCGDGKLHNAIVITAKLNRVQPFDGGRLGPEKAHMAKRQMAGRRVAPGGRQIERGRHLLVRAT